MERKKKLVLSIGDNVQEKLKASAEKMGVSRSAYVSYLIMQKEHEQNAIGFVAKLTPEQIQKAIKEVEERKDA